MIVVLVEQRFRNHGLGLVQADPRGIGPWFCDQALERLHVGTVAIAAAAVGAGRWWWMPDPHVYEVVATMETITLLRSFVRGLLKVADQVPARRALGLA
jgi:hypothetical protein